MSIFSFFGRLFKPTLSKTLAAFHTVADDLEAHIASFATEVKEAEENVARHLNLKAVAEAEAARAARALSKVRELLGHDDATTNVVPMSQKAS